MADNSVELAVFDLDETLIEGDSDYLWGQFLAKSGHIDARPYEAANRRFYEQYLAGTLDINEFTQFSMAPLAQIEPALLDELRATFLLDCIAPVIAKGTKALLAKHRQFGHELIITTATNRFITEPIATLLGVKHLLATEPEMVNGWYTGRLAGAPNFRQGKALRLQQWINDQGRAVTCIYAYSDSHNDLPLLELADQPTAVDPDPQLRAVAKNRGWPIITLRK